MKRDGQSLLLAPGHLASENKLTVTIATWRRPADLIRNEICGHCIQTITALRCGHTWRLIMGSKYPFLLLSYSPLVLICRSRSHPEDLALNYSAAVQGHNHGWKVEGDQGLCPNVPTGRLRPVLGAGGCRLLLLWGSGTIPPPPENFGKLGCYILHSGDYLLWNFLLFENYGQEVGGPIHWCPQPKSWGTSLPRSLRLLRRCRRANNKLLQSCRNCALECSRAMLYIGWF